MFGLFIYLLIFIYWYGSNRISDTISFYIIWIPNNWIVAERIRSDDWLFGRNWSDYEYLQKMNIRFLHNPIYYFSYSWNLTKLNPQRFLQTFISNFFFFRKWNLWINKWTSCNWNLYIVTFGITKSLCLSLFSLIFSIEKVSCLECRIRYQRLPPGAWATLMESGGSQSTILASFHLW